VIDEDRMYAVGVFLGPDGTNKVKVLRHPSGERIYETSVISGDEAGFRLSMERATEFMWKDVREALQA
jgi:hypothetical protein